MRTALGRIRGLLLAAVFGLAVLLGITTTVSTAAHADVDDFTYDSWHVDYEVGLDDEGRAVAHVTETLTPRFPDYNQNRGVVRGLPDEYEDASTRPGDISVTDASGAAVPFEVEHENGFTVIYVGDDDYVHGVQTYVITYTLHDVVLARDDGTADEFYWDLLDFEHAQPIAEFSADIAFSSDLAPQLTGAVRCYNGNAGSEQECDVIERPDGDGYSILPLEAGPREGATIAAALEPGSAVQPPQRLPNPLLDYAPITLGLAAVALAVAATISVGIARRRAAIARGTIVAQYDVPASLPPILAASISRSGDSKTAASEILHLAVTGALRVEDGPAARGLFGDKAGKPVLRYLGPAPQEDPLDARMVEAIFGSAPPGAEKQLPKNDQKFAHEIAAALNAGKRAAVERGYLAKRVLPVARWLGVASLVIAAAAAAFTLVAIRAERPGPWAALAAVACLATLVLGVYAVSRHRVHTPLGAEWREYLEGVKLFIRVAEADRIEMLQSFTGAERRDDDGAAVLELYERLLPYAVMFGLESEWLRTLQVHYDAAPGYVPAWYPALAGHQLGQLTSGISSFTSSVTSSMSYTSSSRGGSSGGGFAGGGGGGGFSGGR